MADENGIQRMLEEVLSIVATEAMYERYIPYLLYHL